MNIIVLQSPDGGTFHFYITVTIGGRPCGRGIELLFFIVPLERCAPGPWDKPEGPFLSAGFGPFASPLGPARSDIFGPFAIDLLGPFLLS